MKKGILITLEGNEGCGKTTQIKLLHAYLKKKGKKVSITRDPGGTAVSDAIREVLLDARNTRMTPICETLLYMASRAQLISEIIRPRLAKGEIVICDRWVDATIAYQGYGGAISVDWIKHLAKEVTKGVTPKLSLFLDLPLEIGLKRAKKRHKADRMERKKLAFHRNVRRGYLAIAKSEPGRFKRVTLSAADDVEAVHAKIRKAVDRVV